MLRIAFYIYLGISLTMIAVSTYTGRRASALSGNPHYLLTNTTVSVYEDVPADNPADAAFDAAMREAGVSTALPVDKPCFVLGFADRTGPTVIAGGFALLVARWWRQRRRKYRPAPIGDSPAADL